MKERRQEKIERVSANIIRTIDEYIDSAGTETESEKLAITMSALTRILTAMAASVGMPPEIVTAAVMAEMEAVLEAMADDNETKH